MKRRQIIGMITIPLILGMTAGATLLAKKANTPKEDNSYSLPLMSAVRSSEPMQGIDMTDYSVSADFSTHMPLVILDMDGAEPPVTVELVDGAYQTIEGLDPYIPGKIEILNSGVMNTIETPVSMHSNVMIKRRGNSSMVYKKPQYLIKLISESGADNPLSVLGMGADEEWVLNGSMNDKSMMRNYLGFKIASMITDFTPDCFYTEVMQRKNGVYYYDGVYLLCESIKQGKSRVNISEYRASDSFFSYIVRRDRFDPEAITLLTYGYLNQINSQYGAIALRYPTKTRASEKAIAYITDDLSKIEEILYSDDLNTFRTYPKYINVDSFVDYFIINEFFGNYDAGTNSTYMYKDVRGRLCIGPVWDFDDGANNAVMVVMHPQDIAFQVKAMYDRLVLDKWFLEKMLQRYYDLRRDVLSETQVELTIDAIRDYLGDSQTREWQRWDQANITDRLAILYQDENDPESLIDRNSTSYANEIYRLKTIVREHAGIIPLRIRALEDSSIFNTGQDKNRTAFALGCLMIFLVPAYVMGRR